MAKIKLKTEIEVEMDIQFPVYKEYAGFVKIISESEYIRVSDTGIDHNKYMSNCVTNILMNGRDVTESKFMEALSEQLDKFTNILSLHTQKVFLEAASNDEDATLQITNVYAAAEWADQDREEEVIRVHSEIFSRNMDLCDAINNDFGYLNDLDKVINEQNNY